MKRPLLVGFVLSLLLALPGRAEDEELLRTMPFKLRDRGAARRAVRDVERHLQAGRTELALERAQYVLDDLPDDLMWVETDAASTRWQLAAERVREILAGLPPEQRAAYDRLTRGAARAEIEQALAGRDARRLEDVVRRYGASGPGTEAARLLVEAQLESGRVHDAAWWAKEGLRYAPDDVRLLAQQVDALGLAGERAELARISEGLTSDAHPFLVDRLLAWRERLGPEAQTLPSSWSLWGGSPGRNRGASGEGPALETPRWQSPAPLPFRSLDREMRSGWMQEEDRISFWAWWEAFRPLHPAVDGRAAYVGNGRALYAIDLYSGRRLWEFDDASGSALDLIDPDRMGPGRTSFERAFAPVLSDDLVVGTVEVDRPYDPEYLQYVEISTYLPARRLVAVDRETGALRWWMGEHPGESLRLDGVSVVSPPVVSEGVVVAVTSRYTGSQHEVGMIGLDARTGRLRWYRVLGVGQQELNLFGSPVKELAACAPAVRDGVAYATTGLGFVAAVSVRTGRPRWIASYEIQPIWPVQYWFRAPVRFPLVAPSPAVVADDVVLVAPTDGRHLSAYALDDGSLRWRVPYPPLIRRGHASQFLGVADDGRRRVALFAADALRAYGVEDGKLAWEGTFATRLGDANVPVGRGIVAGDHVLAPTLEGLARFSLSREGGFEGMTPWPRGLDGGNVLPLPHILLVAERDRLTGFYSWERIERDVARRRAEHPRDPEILLEAGDVYAMGGAFERALDAFEGARSLAEDAGLEAARARARAGLFRTWMRIGERSIDTDPREAREAFRRALGWADGARERVLAHVHLDALLLEDPDARVENLEKLVETSAGLRARFPGYREEVPARAAALLRLADAELARRRPDRAVEALQRVLAEEGDARIDGQAAGERARRLIDEIVALWGAEVYAPHEEAARRLLETARQDGDPELLDGILRKYPNARVVPEALYRLATARLEDGDPVGASRALMDLLRQGPSGPWAAPGAARLAAALEALDRRGTARFTWTWLATNHPDAVLEEGEQRGVVAELAPAALERLTPEPPPPARPLASGLREVRVVPAGADSWGTQIDVTAPRSHPAPLALYRDGERIVAVDLPGARVAFEDAVGHVRRAAWETGTLVLAVPSAVVGLDDRTGGRRWTYDVRGSVTELRAEAGLVFALVQDTSRGSNGERTLVALDLERGTRLWERPLERLEYRDLELAGTDVLLRQTRYEGTTVWPAVMLFDGLTGSLKNVVDLPARTVQSDPVLVGRRLVFVLRDGEDRMVLTGLDLDRRHTAWTRPLLGRESVAALLAIGEDEVLVLQRDGYVSTCRASDGEPGDATRILVGDGRDVRIQPLTEAHVVGDRLIFMPYARQTRSIVGAWNRRTGKILWEQGWPSDEHASRAGLCTQGEGPVLAMAAWTRDRPSAEVRVRLLDLGTGNVIEEIEPRGLGAERGPISIVAGWGTVVVFGNDAAIVYASGDPRPR